MKIIKIMSLTAIAISIFSACAPISNSSTSLSQTNSKNNSQQVPADQTDPAANQNPINSQIFCTKMILANITWPTEIGNAFWPSYFALTLNLTGSYEGHEGWKNIANNSDNQGLSLGLMQQNLGQSTLQPLLIKMFKLDHTTILQNFSPADYSSLRTMLEDWQNGAIAPQPTMVQLRSIASDELFPDVDYFNELDSGYLQFKESATAAGTKPSVQWAMTNLYSGSNFIPRWKKSLQDTALSTTYRNLQVEAASAMFVQAKKYLDYFKFKQLRSLLFLYDVVVQNGGFTAANKNLYTNWLSKNPSATELQRLLSLRNILVDRLDPAKPKNKQDVFDRKTSIIDGSGTVHGESRNYPKEYCYDPLRSI